MVTSSGLTRSAEATHAYPLVTLAEGHISVMLKFFGVEGTKGVAQQYANELLAVRIRHPGDRLSEAVHDVLLLLTNWEGIIWTAVPRRKLTDAARPSNYSPRMAICMGRSRAILGG